MRRLLALAAALSVAAASAPGTALAQEGGARIDKNAPPPPPPQPTLTKPPELLEAVPPEYPAEAQAAGLTAEVTVRIHVDATGAVSKVDVVTPVGHGFDEAAVAAAMKYRFAPAEWDGKPGPIVVETTINFVLQQEEVEVPAADQGTATQPSGAGDKATAVGQGRLVGVVKERGTRRKLSGATVVVEALGVEAITDEGGRFELPDLPAGSYRVVVVLSGYDRYEAGVAVYEGEATDATLYLRPRGGNPYETTIEGDKDKLEVTRRTVNRRIMTTVPGTFGDPLRVIQNLPGMNRAPYILGVLLIRGSNPDDSGVYVDGFEVPILYHFLGGPSIFSPELLDTIDLYPGGFPARFGRNIGGIVEVNTRPSESDGVHGAADIDLLDSSVYLRAPITKTISVAAAGRRSYLDTVLPFFLPEPDPGEQLIVVPVYYDYQLRADVDLPGPDTFGIMLFGSSDELDVLQTTAENTFDLNSSVGFWRVRASYGTRIADGKLALTLSATTGRDEISFEGGEFTAAKISQDVIGVRERVSGELRPGLRLDAGLDMEYRLNRYDLKLPIAPDIPMTGAEVDVPPELFERVIDSYGLGAWVELAWQLPRGVKLVPGLRLDSFLLAGEPRLSLDPRLMVRWQMDPRTAFKAYGGLYHQAPQAEGYDQQFGNPKLGLEYAVHTGAGVERKLGRVLSLEAEAYYVDRRNQAQFVQDDFVMNPDGSVDQINFANREIGRTYGLELLLRHEVTKRFYGWISYTLARSERKRDKEPWEATNFDQTHNLILVGSYRLDGGWELGGRFRLTSGRPETPIYGGTYDADADVYVPVTGPDNSDRRPYFHQLDIRAEKNWLFDTWSIGAYIDIQNVYNAENPEATQWDYRYRESAPVRGLPFLPTFGVKGQW